MNRLDRIDDKLGLFEGLLEETAERAMRSSLESAKGATFSSEVELVYPSDVGALLPSQDDSTSSILIEVRPEIWPVFDRVVPHQQVVFNCSF
jgi:hypothetical protein